MSLPVKIGNYRFERNLGNGTFGKVKRKFSHLGYDCIDRLARLKVWSARIDLEFANSASILFSSNF